MRTAGEQRKQAERELADAAQTLDDLETKIDEARANAEIMETKFAEFQAANQAQAIDLAQIRERLSATETERMRYKSEAESLRAEHEESSKLRGQIEAMQTHITSLMAALAKRQD